MASYDRSVELSMLGASVGEIATEILDQPVVRVRHEHKASYREELGRAMNDS